MIERIERLEAELQLETLKDTHVFERERSEVERAKPTDDPLARVAIREFLRPRKGLGTEPAERRTLIARQKPLPHHIRP